MRARKEAHQQNLDAAQREIDRRAAEGEDMSRAFVNPITYAIEFRPSWTEVLTAVLHIWRGDRQALVRIESITELQADVARYGWTAIAHGSPYTGCQARAAYDEMMDSLRQMFAPVEG